MKKILAILAISFSALMATSITTAGPHEKHENNRGWDHPRQQQSNNGRDFREDDDDRMQDKRRVREERGVKRLQQHK